MTPLERLHKHRDKKREASLQEWRRQHPDGTWFGLKIVDLAEVLGPLKELKTRRKFRFR